MHVLGQETPLISNKLWSEDELRRTIRAHFASKQRIIPNDAFYGNMRTKRDLEKIADNIEKAFGIKTQVIYRLTRDMHTGGSVDISKERTNIILPNSILLDPFKAAAILTHLLAHVFLYEKKLSHIDPDENERIADLATIYAGLGYVVSNGLCPMGWKKLLSRCRKPAALGNLTTENYFLTLRNYEQEARFHDTDPPVVPWIIKKLYGQEKEFSETPKIINDANARNKRSLQYFYMTVITFILIAGLLIWSLAYRPAYADIELRNLSNTAKILHNKHLACINQLNDINSKLNDDITKDRLLSAQLGRCKSLENQYNSAAERHNDYLARFGKR